MAQEEKKLLIKDLCGRVPYVTFVYVDWHETEELEICEGCEDDEEEPNIHTLISCNYYGECDLDDNLSKTIYDIKPYLRPMSSMTEEEWKEFSVFIGRTERHAQQICLDADSMTNPVIGGFQCVYWGLFDKCIDWLNAHHFDYRGLIEKGLALEAPEDMYKFD